MRVKLVTSFNERLWEQYAKKCLDTWKEYLFLDEGSIIEIWINGIFPVGLPLVINNIPVTYKCLDTQSDGWVYFYETFSQIQRPQVPPSDTFRYNFMPFSCKVFALAEASFKLKDGGIFNSSKPMLPGEFREIIPAVDALLWLDADVILKKKVTSEVLKSFLGDASLAWLDRGPQWGYGDTGFILCDVRKNNLDVFFEQANTYGSGQLFFYREWHDAFIFSAIVKMKEFMDIKFKAKNLNEDMNSEHKNGLYPFETSVLKEYFDHLKGPRKDELSVNK